MNMHVLGFILHVSAVTAVVLTASPTTRTDLERRDASDTLPTFTFGPQARYIPRTVAHPEPTGTSLQIYPTGIHDDFPKEGITIAFGPELRKQIKEIMAQNCKGKDEQQCQNALIPLLHNTDVATHTKRFAVVGAIILGWGLAAIISEALMLFGSSAYLGNDANEMPKELQFHQGDLEQLHSIAGVYTFAVVTAATALPSTVIYQPPATSTAPDFISIETLNADRDGHKQGDIVYHIPDAFAQRIQDFLGMTGMQQTQEVCKDQNFKRADNVQECLRRIQRHGMDLADTGPSNLLQLAGRNVPARPGQGQGVGFPIQDIAANGALLIIPVYHVVFEHIPRAPDAIGNWDPMILAKSAMGITISAHAAMFAGQSLLEIWVDKDKLVHDLKEEDLACPKDLVCLMNNCRGQEEKQSLVGLEMKQELPMTPICKVVKTYGCRCAVVTYPHVLEVPQNYMKKQYEWLEELVTRAALPSFEPQCSQGEQKLADAANKLQDIIELACNENPGLKDSWTYSDSKEGFTFGITFQKKGGPCPFDCRGVFQSFAESDSCITSTGLQKNGKVDTECGTASYLAYRLS